MSDVNWLDVLDWGNEELEDLRFVGYSYLKQGKYDIAITFFEALVVLEPGHAYDLQTLGGLHLQKGNNLVALNYLEKALKIEPDHLPTKLNRVKTLFALGYRKQAIADAKLLQQSGDPSISDQAEALLLAHA